MIKWWKSEWWDILGLSTLCRVKVVVGPWTPLSPSQWAFLVAWGLDHGLTLYCTSDAHDGQMMEWKGYPASNTCITHCGATGLLRFCREERGQSLVCGGNGPTKASCAWQYERCKGGMFYVSDCLIICSLFDIFIVAVAWRKLSLPVSGGEWLNTLTSKKALSNLLPQKPSAAASTCSLAPSWVLVDALERASPVMGCKCGSIATLWQTSDIRWAVRSLIS